MHSIYELFLEPSTACFGQGLNSWYQHPNESKSLKHSVMTPHYIYMKLVSKHRLNFWFHCDQSHQSSILLCLPLGISCVLFILPLALFFKWNRLRPRFKVIEENRFRTVNAEFTDTAINHRRGKYLHYDHSFKNARKDVNAGVFMWHTFLSSSLKSLSNKRQTVLNCWFNFVAWLVDLQCFFFQPYYAAWTHL